MRRHLLILPAGLFLGLFLVVPYLNIIFISVHAASDSAPYGPGFTLSHYVDVLTDGYLLRQIVTTIRIGMITTLCALLLGFPVAWSMTLVSRRWRTVQQAIVLAPLLVGIVVRSYGWTILLGNNGVFNRMARAIGLTNSALPLMYDSFGIIVALTHVFLPFMILPIFASLQGLDPSLALAGRSLGASPLVTFRRIVIPLALPGIQSGCVMVFILSISAYVTPMLIGGMRVKTLPMTVVNTLIDAFQWPKGAAQALILTAIGTVIVTLFVRLLPTRWHQS